jgi:ABC-2 type transport system permease protein
MQKAAISRSKTLSDPGIDLSVSSGMRLILGKEIVANLRSLRVPVVLLTMTTLFLISAHLLAIEYRQRLSNWNINQDAQDDPSQGDRVLYNSPDGSFFYITGTAPYPPMFPPQPLSMLIKGMDNKADRAVVISQKIAIWPRQDDNTLLSLYGTPDIAFLARLLLSLFALFFSLDLITSEKESGTLRALLSHPLRRREILLGKAIGAAISLLVPFSFAYFSAVAYLYFAQGMPVGRYEFIRILLIYGLSLLYGLVFISIGLFISTLTARTKTAIMVALLAWGTLVLVLPNMAILGAKLISPTTSYNQLNARLNQARQQIKQKWLSNNPGAQDLADISNEKEVRLLEFDADKRLTDEYFDSKWKEINRARWLSVALPAGALAFGASDLASTGASDYHSYAERLRSNRDRILDVNRRRWGMSLGEGDKLWENTSQETALPYQQAAPLKASAIPILAATASLITWTSVFALASYRRFRRYDVR